MSVNSVSQPLIANESIKVKKSLGDLKFKVCLFLILGFCLLIITGGLLGFLPSISSNFIFLLIGLLCLSLLLLGLACAYRFALSKVRKDQERIFKQAFEAQLREAERLEHDLGEEVGSMVGFICNVHRLESCSFGSSDQKISLLRQQRLELNENMSRLEKDCRNFSERKSVFEKFLGVEIFDRDIGDYSRLIGQILSRTEHSLNLANDISVCLEENLTNIKALNLQIKSFERLLQAKRDLIKLYENPQEDRNNKNRRRR